MMTPLEVNLRREIVRIGQLMYRKGFISASDGNLSARLEGSRILITPSGLHKGFLEPDHLLVVDEEGHVLGPRTAMNRALGPTSELPMHLEAYRQRADIGAVIHAHPAITIALSIAGISLADCLVPEAIVMLGIVPTTQYATPSSSENMLAIRTLVRSHDVIVLQRHGSLTVGADPMQCFMRLETLEQTARIRLMLAQLGVHSPLPADEVRKLLRMREQMGLCRPGEAEAFCEVCGVCHTGDVHPPLMAASPAGYGRNPSGTTGWPPDEAEMQAMVSRIVSRTLGDGE